MRKSKIKIKNVIKLKPKLARKAENSQGRSGEAA